MQEQLSNSVKFLGFYTAAGVGKTGLTVTVDVFDPSGTLIVTAAAATEVGDGLYSYTLASTATTSVGEYVAVFKTADTTVAQQHLPALWVIGRDGDEHLDADVSTRLATSGYTAPDNATVAATKTELDALAAAYTAVRAAKLDLIGTGSITVNAPVTAAGTIDLQPGDDYYAADGRALSWSSTDWPNLTSATVAFTITLGTGSDITAAGTVVTPTGTAVVQVELAAAQTGQLEAGRYGYTVAATLPSGHVVTLATGTVGAA